MNTQEDEIHTDIQVKVMPRSSREQVVVEDGLYKVKLTAPPLEGKANKALVRLLSKKLRVPKGAVRIVSGETSRRKRIRIDGVTAEAVEKALSKV
ncbi:MAG: YggU family protein [Deltaproteobacteria bacterium]|nr:YggU family protein [Deltaproteobacteria bacterium]